VGATVIEETASLIAVGRHLGPYEIIKLLGSGGMGEVYRARDSRLRRDVAIKVLPRDYARDPELLKRLSREARAVGQLNHPNIVAVYDVGSEDGGEYVVMELLEGETLGRKLLESGPLSARKTLDYAVQIARGLAAAHEKNIIHRDLKPENIFITRESRLKILDFGLAHQLPSENDLGKLSSKLTTPGTTMGTAAYMSPEQARGLPVDHRTDLFSFGVVLYEMLSGRLPFDAPTALETMYAILNGEPPDLRELVPGLPPVLYRVVAHCLEKSPDKRFQSANDLIFDLENCSEISWPAATAPAPIAARRKRLGRAAIAGVLAVIVAIGALALWQWRAPAAVDPSFRRLTFKPTLIQSARFTADGQTVVYSASRRWQPLGLNMLRVDRPESHVLPIPDAELASISRTGEMAVILDAPLFGSQLESYAGGTLAEVPVLGGTPREIADRVILADWAPDGRLAVWRKSEKGVFQLEFPPGRVLYTSSRIAYSMRVSPKGDQIAMNVSVNDQMSDVIVIGPDGRKRTVASAPVRARGMAWSADGKEVWYVTARDAQQVPTMYAVTLDGEQRRVMRSPGWPWLHDVAPDGTLLLAITATQGGIIMEDGGPEKASDLSWFDASILADVSSDGKQIIFTESWEGVQYQLTVYMRGTDDSPAVRLGEGIALAFSPDKSMVLALRPGPKRRELVLLSTGPGNPETLRNDLDCLWAGFLPDGRILINAKSAEGPRMFIQARDGAPPRPLTPPGIAIGTINVVGSGAIKPVSPDGGSVLVFDREQRAWLYSLGDSSGKPPIRRAAGVLPGDRPAGWSRDGRHIYVYPVLQLPVKVYDVDLVTGERRLLREFTVPDPEGVFRISPILLMPDGHSFAYGYYRAVSTLYTATGFQ
jgi:Tol biopolymer transport system component/tRNA A-37 threonylcarbamoyl transferase component Bud32